MVYRADCWRNDLRNIDAIFEDMQRIDIEHTGEIMSELSQLDEDMQGLKMSRINEKTLTKLEFLKKHLKDQEAFFGQFGNQIDYNAKQLEENLKSIKDASNILIKHKNTYITNDYDQFLDLIRDNIKTLNQLQKISDHLEKDYEKVKKGIHENEQQFKKFLKMELERTRKDVDTLMNKNKGFDELFQQIRDKEFQAPHNLRNILNKIDDQI